MFKKRRSGNDAASASSGGQAGARAYTEEDYFKEASAWDVDRIALIRRSERRAWIFTAIFAMVCACAMATVALLMPLKRVEPFVIRVDNATGIVDVVNTLRTSSNTYDEAVSKYFLGRYIRAREGYAPTTFGLAYQEAGYLSSMQMRTALFDEFNPQNPSSPVNIYKQGEATVQIKTIAFIKPNIASVRYLKKTTASDREALTHWVATIEFRYLNAPETEDARQFNPLGFQVVGFRTDPEALVETAK